MTAECRSCIVQGTGEAPGTVRLSGAIILKSGQDNCWKGSRYMRGIIKRYLSKVVSDSGILPKKDSYLVTEDLSVVVPATAKRLGIPEAALKSHFNGSFYDELMEEVVHLMRTHCLNDEDVDIVPLSNDSFSDMLHKRVTKGKSGGEFWICLDNVYTRFECEQAAYPVNITLYLDEHLDSLEERGPRPEDGDTSLAGQIAECADMYNKCRESGEVLNPVVVDDNTFSGMTVVTVLREAANRNLYVEHVRLGIGRLEGLLRIGAWNTVDKQGTGRRVRFLGVSKLSPGYYARNSERDFFPGILYAGKVIGEKRDGMLHPVMVGEQKKPVRAQCLYGWGDTTRWTMLRHGLVPFTCGMLGLSLRIWERLQELSDRLVLVEDLPAVPWKMYSSDDEKMHKNLKKSWLEVLKEEYRSIGADERPDQDAGSF